MSTRRVDIANSARSWSLSAWISAIASGVAASSHRMVRRVARLWTSGTSTSPSRLAHKNPIPKYMIISIMNASGSALPSEQFAKKARPDLIRPHASPLKMRLNYETAAFSHAARLEPARQHATAPGLLPAWRAINLDRSARRSSGRRWPDVVRAFGIGSARSVSERVPGRFRRELEVAHVGAQPQPDARADRQQHDIVGGQRRHAEAADEISGAVDAAEALIDRVRGGQIVDQHHGAGPVAPDVPAERGSLKKD